MSDIALVYATFEDRADAERVAQTVLAERLAACVNILSPCASIYRWKGQIESGEETPALFKTLPNLADALRTRIADLHRYDLPVIEAWPVAATTKVFDWVDAETGN